MTDHNYAPNNMQLYQELKKRFPNAAHAMLMETIEKHGNNVQRCIEDLSLSSPGQFNLSSHLYNLNMQRNPYPIGTDNRQQPNPAAGARSRSVSGVPGVRGDERLGHGFGYPNINQTQRQHPQSAPVITGCSSPFTSGVRFSFSKNSSSENMNTPSREQPPFHSSANYSPVTSTATTATAKAKPPVPPPTYRSHVEQPQHTNSPMHHQYPGNSTREHHHGLYPLLPNDLSNERAASSPSQQGKHKTSLTMIPSSPEYNDPWCSPPMGWSPSMGTHSTSVNLQLGPSSGKPTVHPEVKICTSGMNYSNKSLNTSPRLSPMASKSSPQTSPQCLSRLHIAISPNGGSISAMRSQINPHSPLPSARFQLQIPSEGNSPVNINFSPSTASSPGVRPTTLQASPRVSPLLFEEGFYGPRSIFDEEDPEQRRVMHSPLKPVPSPRKGETNAWSNESLWPAAAPPNDVCVSQNELCSGEAYSQALLTHQKQKFDTLQRELERDKAQLEHYRREVTNKELFSFRQQICQDQTFFTFEDLQNLRAEIRSLMVDCQCMTRLVDLLHKGQVPLGETNEDFYKTIHTGQQGPVHVPALQIGIPPSIPMPRITSEHSRPSQPLPQSPNPSLLTVVSEAVNPKPPQQDEDDDGQRWECCACTFHNNPAMVMCEMCEMPKFVQGEETHNFRIHVQQNSSCAAANKALQLKLTHRLGAVRR